MKKLFVVLVALMLIGVSVKVFATPSTQIWNPSTDIQALGTFHLGIDNYFSVSSNDTKPYAFPTDVGLTYGAFKNLEVGVDLIEPTADPLYLNFKYGLPEGDVIPAVAVGAFNIGTKKDVTDYNVLYGVVAKTFKPVGRLTFGYYNGNDKLYIDENGDKVNSGLIATWDKTITDKIWASVDYSSGKGAYGCLSLGGSYMFAPNTSIILAYVIYNNDKINVNNQVTTQLDINF